MILVCSCAHKVQDEMYGKNRRVHNLTKDKTKARCTVCGKLNSTGQVEIKKE